MAIQVIDVGPPIGGLHRGVGFQSEVPYFYDDGLNVFPRDVFEQRERLGSRPGLVKAFPAGVTGPVHLLANVRAVEATGETTYPEPFNTQLGAQWSRAPWKEQRVGINTSLGYAFVYSKDAIIPNDGAEVLNSLGIDTAKLSTVSLEVLNDSDHGGNSNLFSNSTAVFSVFARLNNANPSLADCVEAQIDFKVSPPVLYLNFYNTGGVKTSYSATVNGAIGFPGILSLRISDTSVCTVDIDMVTGSGPQIVQTDPSAVSLSLRQRFGFGIKGPRESESAVGRHCRAEWFRVDYEGDPPSPNRNIIVALGGSSAAGVNADIKFEDTPGALIAPTAPSPVRANPKARQLQAAELLGDLYIVGEDAEGVWKFDPDGSGTLSQLISSAFDSGVAGAGTLNAILIAAWRSRLCVVSRDDPHNIAMSKVGDPTNWTYTALPVGSALRLNTTGIDSGKIGEPINALIAHSDDQLVIGCLNSLYVLRGDPTYGGQIDRLSSSIGIAAPQAWARGPDGETVLLSTDGLYGIAPGVSGYPISLSREPLPQELRDIDVNNYRILMAYDVRNRGVFIGITPILGSGGTYWWFDWQKRGFHPMSFNASHEPTALAFRQADSPLDQRLIFGCRDGHIRSMNDNAFNDDGVPFTPRVLIGPIMLGGGGYYDGMLRECVVQTAVGSADVQCSFLVGNSIEAARKATARAAFTAKGGKNLTNRPNLRGSACYIKLEGTPPWAPELITLTRERLGKQRL